MILFNGDWSKYPNARADTSTTNKTFVRYASLLKAMGHKNHLWPLAVLDPSVIGLDPHSPRLTTEQKTSIMIECRYNPIYFIREVVRIPPQSGLEPVQYRAHRGNMALVWGFLTNLIVYLIQPRQTGKSVGADVLDVWCIFIGMYNTRINTLTKDAKLRTDNIERIKMIRDLLPQWMIVKSQKDPNNSVEVRYTQNNNRYCPNIAQHTEAGALNVGRGSTAAITKFDEFGYIKNIKVSHSVLLSAGTAARAEAKRNNQPWGISYTTTAGKRDTPEGKFAYEVLQSGMTWDEKVFDCSNIKELHKTVQANSKSKAPMVSCVFSHTQLGYSDQWLEETLSETKSVGEDADRDYFNKWTNGTLSSPLPVVYTKRIAESERPVKYTEITPHGYVIRWYITESEVKTIYANRNIVLGIDTSEAVKRDDIGGVFVDTTDLAVVGCFTVNETNTGKFALFLVWILATYLNVTMIIERKSTGITIIDILLLELPKLGIDPFKRLYSRVVDEAAQRKEEYMELRANKAPSVDSCERYRHLVGFSTTGRSRDNLYSSVLLNGAKLSSHLIRDSVLAGQILGLSTKSGRIDHASSGHDDMVVSWLFALYLILESKNLDFYGIDAARCLSMVREDGVELTDEEVVIEERQQAIRDEETKLQDKLKVATTNLDRIKLTAQLNRLKSTKQMETARVMTVDAVTRQANERKFKPNPAIYGI